MSSDNSSIESSPSEPSPARRFTFWALMAATALMVSLLTPLWRPLLLAGVLAAAVMSINEKLVGKVGGRRWLAATLMTLGINILILAPIAGLVITAVSQADEAAGALRSFISNGGYKVALKVLPDPVAERALEYAGKLPEELKELTSETGSLARRAVGGLSVLGSFITQYVLMTIALFFFLSDGLRLRRWLASSVPLRTDRTRQLSNRFRETARVVLGANLITALAQSTVATIGYFIASVPQALFFGLLTFFTSFFPAIGTALVALPLAALLFLNGHTYSAVFLALWAVVVVGLVDNIVRPLLTRGKEQLHGAVVFFSLLGGVAVFGAVGLVLGPLALSVFLTLLHLWKQETEGAAGSS